MTFIGNRNITTSLAQTTLFVMDDVIKISIVFFCRFVVSFTFYGITMNVGKFGGNIHLAYPLLVSMEFVGYSLLFAMNRIGHKRTLISAHIITGTSLLIAMFIVMFVDESRYQIINI